MTQKHACLLLATLLSACAATEPGRDPTDSDEGSRQAIVGGKKTSAFPAVGALTLRGAPHCTGTLIAPREVLTAAHCLAGVAPSSLRFVLGSDIASPDAELAVASVTPHPSYDPVRIENDIGFATLASEAPVAPLAALEQMDATWAGRALTFVGYGITSAAGKGAGIKRSVVMPIHEVGATRFDYQMSGKNTCNGDSGGPALAKLQGEWRVAGVTSYGDAYCRYYGVDTRVDVFRSFLPLQGPAPDGGADDPCQGETYAGRCDGTTVIWCEGTEVQSLSCSQCGFDAQAGYFDCV